MHKLKLIPKVLQHISECNNKAFEEKMNYPEFVDALFKQKSNPLESLVHCGLGVTGEAGEFADCIKKAWAYNGDIETLDQTNFIEELGDLAFYMQKALNMAGVSWDHIQAVNYTKLSKRYPDGKFTSQHAHDRLDKQEEQSDMFEGVPHEPTQPPQAQHPIPPQAPTPESNELGANAFIKNGNVLRSLDPNGIYAVKTQGVKFDAKLVFVDAEKSKLTFHVFGNLPFDIVELPKVNITTALDGSALIVVKVKDVERLELAYVTEYAGDAIPQEMLSGSNIVEAYIELIGGVGANAMLIGYNNVGNVLHTQMKITMAEVLHKHSISANFPSGSITFGLNTGEGFVDVFFDISSIRCITLNDGEDSHNA